MPEPTELQTTDETKAGLTRYVDPSSGLDILTLGNTLARSGYFKDAAQAAQAVVKVLYGRELGIGPISAMAGIHIVEGKPSLAATVMAALVKRSMRYDYRVIEHTDLVCRIQFFERDHAGVWASAGESSFSVQDASRVGLAGRDTWRKYPKNMLFARAMSNGFKWYCPELSGGAPTYDPDEVEDFRRPPSRRLDAVVEAAGKKDTVVINSTTTTREAPPPAAEQASESDAGSGGDSQPSPRRGGSRDSMLTVKRAQEANTLEAGSAGDGGAVPQRVETGIAAPPPARTVEHPGEKPGQMFVAEVDEALSLPKEEREALAAVALWVAAHPAPAPAGADVGDVEEQAEGRTLRARGARPPFETSTSSSPEPQGADSGGGHVAPVVETLPSEETRRPDLLARLQTALEALGLTVASKRGQREWILQRHLSGSTPQNAPIERLTKTVEAIEDMVLQKSAGR